MTHSPDLELDEELLSPEHAAILRAVLASRSMEEAAQALNISRATLYRKLEQPELAGALRKARAQLLEQAITKLQEEASEAVEALGAVIRDKRASAASRVRAAEVILDFALKGSEMLDIRAEIQELRAYHEQLSKD